VTASAHSGDHDKAFYEAAIEETFGATATSASLTNVNTDDDGALVPGRYLLQAAGTLVPGQTLWVHRGRFTAGTALSPIGGAAVAGPARFPLTATIVALEFHVLGGYSDRIAVQLGSGSDVTVYLSRVSSAVRKSNRRA
jgi:hypothetical protein